MISESNYNTQNREAFLIHILVDVNKYYSLGPSVAIKLDPKFNHRYLLSYS